MTAVLLTTDSPLWEYREVVDAISDGPDWPAKVAAFWAVTAKAAHEQSHPSGKVFACPGCDPTVLCPLASCAKPAQDCPDPLGHDRLWRGSEESLLIGVGHYGRDGR